MKKGRDPPYLFMQYNVSGHYIMKASIYNAINRLLYAFTEALNEKALLPKIILVAPDIDLLAGQQNKQGISVIIGAILHYVIKQMDLLIHRRMSIRK